MTLFSEGRRRVARFMVPIVAGVIVMGCDRRVSESPSIADLTATARDIEAAIFPVPGDGVRRGMRVRAFARGLAIADCGGTPPPVDETADRFSQDLFPDLTLIRDRGLAEPFHDDAAIGDECDLRPTAIPSYRTWMALGLQWVTFATEVQRTRAGLKPLRRQMRRCLQTRTGLLAQGPVPRGYLIAVNDADGAGSSRDEYMRWSAAYAACGSAYFDELARELEAQRAAIVNRHRSFLRRAATEVAKAGYVP